MSSEVTEASHLSFLRQVQKLADETGHGPMVAKALEGVPGVARFAPTLDANAPISMLALEIGRLVATRNIYLKGEEIITIDEKGTQKPMTAARFCGWIESFCCFKEYHGRTSLSRETSSLILAQDVFRNALRPLNAVHMARIPVIRSSGSLELLPIGYDLETAVFTIDPLNYAEDMRPEDAFDFICDLLGEYPWPDRATGHLGQNRSASAQLLAMLGVFCRSMLPQGAKRPIIVWLGNQPGTGKSTLAAMPLLPVFGEAASTDLPERREEVEKTLATKANTLAPYIFFDDVGGGVFSNALNRFATASMHTGRVMGGNREEYRVPNVSQVFITGNNIKLTSDLMRRAIIIELFLAGEAQGRKFKREITDSWLCSETTRKDLLSALWSVVRWWGENGRPRHPCPMATFEDWTAIIGGMVLNFKFTDPLAAPDLPMGGDQEKQEWQRLLVALADDIEEKREYTRAEIIQKARELGLLEDLLGNEGDEAPNSTENKKFGRRLQTWRGRQLKDSRGRTFEFGHRRTTKAKVYPCVITSSSDLAPGA